VTITASEYSNGVPEHQLRSADLPETSYVCGIPLYPVGHTVWLYGAPGVGKSFIQQGMNHTIAWGKPIGSGPTRFAPDITANILYVDMEGTMSLVKERSLALTPYGTLASDRPDGGDMPTTTTYLFSGEITDPATGRTYVHIAGKTFPERLAELEARLEYQETVGVPYSLVIIDTYTLFVGANTTSKNSYDFDAEYVKAFNTLAGRYDVCIVFVHHPNKSGEMSGSVARTGTSSMVLHFERTGKNASGEEEAVLTMEKNRVGPELSFVFTWDKNRIWRLATDMPVKVAIAKGNNRAILAMLSERGVMSKGELMADTGLPGGSIDSALNRMAKRGLVVRDEEGWRATFAPTQHMPAMPVHEPIRWDRCAACGSVLQPDFGCPNVQCENFDWSRDGSGIGTEVAQETDQAGPAPMEIRPHQKRAVLPDLRLDKSGLDPANPKDGAIKASMALMKQSVQRNTARYRPSLFAAQPDIPKEEIWEGRNKWSAVEQLADGTVIVRLDKTAAYLSAANTHLPVGPIVLDEDPYAAVREKRAGYHLVRVPEDPVVCGGPFHVREDRTTAWITTPTLKQIRGVVHDVEILESYTAPATEVLLRPWIDVLKAERAAALAQDPDGPLYAFVKNCYSLVISTMGESKANWELRRPDWMHIIRAQAFANLWNKALQATLAGVEVVKVGNTDEIWIVDDEEHSWRRATYTNKSGAHPVFPIGTDLGEWRVKERRIVGGTA